MAEHRINPLKRKIASGGVGVIANGLNTSAMCDYLGQFGFDAGFVDFEHGNVSWAELADISRACDLWDMATVVRVNRLDEAQVLRALDQGASVVMAPHIITPEQAELLAKACRYPPHGIRGVAGSRRAYGVSDYFKRSDEEVMAMALIEDYQAIKDIRELVKVDGIDVFYVAPSDLAASMGHTGNAGHADVLAAIDQAVSAITRAGRVAGTLVNDSNVEAYVAKGVRCLGVAWQGWVASGATAFLKKVSTSRKPGLQPVKIVR
jgi:4-hydroxy-2-oxoheptanedioate aldolase